MSIKPPPTPFDAAIDHDRLLLTIEAMARQLREGQRDGSRLLHQIGRLALIAQSMKTLAVDGEARRPGVDANNRDASVLFPAYRAFSDRGQFWDQDEREILLIVQDLHVVWNGTEFEGDGSCTLNKAHAMRQFVYPQRAMILHSNRDPWGRVGERNVHGRWYIPPMQNFLFTLEPGDYVVGELYTEIC